MAWGKKLLLSLSVFAIRQRKRLPDGSSVNFVNEGDDENNRQQTFFL